MSTVKGGNPPFQLADPTLFHQESYVHGQWVPATSSKRFDVLDPGTGKVWATCPDNGPQDVDAAITSSHKAFQEYSVLNPRKRAQLLLTWHNLISKARDDLAKLLTYETGKPLSEANAEIEYSLGFTWWFAGEAERIQGSISIPSAPNRRVLVIKQPIGVSVALVPWNFPVAMILRKAGAALAAGCTMVVKPSPETPLTCLALADLATRAGFPDGVFNVLTTSLENTPSLSEAMFFDDADLEQALDQLMTLKWRNAGQACISANRVYVQAGVYDKFATMFVEKTSKLNIGHGAAPDTTFGAVTTPIGLEKAESQVQDAVSRGAKLALGSGKPFTPAGQGSRGYFMKPVVLTNMNSSMKMSCEETFGPVCGLFRFDTEDEVIKLANDTSMGLASYAFTKNANRLWRMFEKLEAGMIGLNTGNGSAAESPFGGIKESGYGKESGKDVAVAECLIEKTGTWTIN
ncbi:hypothetical protein CEP52_014658 [Fusarium oligoseptatum]|uniref:Aldehyde dehydrogenase domain-containing protein n=1 Tax=Fusarium oligoseptatum TaxID=2604345 RepID=A0A428SKH5_9HYPO|nr:hypothetical protein CEP52_014658 [Fusarium oligoseptatum]